jgi:RecB family exonuclease
MNPNFYISEDDNIILNGLVDWIEYLPDDTLHLIDFKTGKHEEKEQSLQLPIYLLLCNALQKRKVSRASYWYLESDKMVEKELPDAITAETSVIEIARKVKEARARGINISSRKKKLSSIISQ